ncbi:unnamed protein product [Orchesella dallaii]|uniref:DUF1279 domain-containing protein n=1 Tax=Orchesella dallaii TaxID=48710 RepID=A0ABP1QRY7_9HEXA
MMLHTLFGRLLIAGGRPFCRQNKVAAYQSSHQYYATSIVTRRIISNVATSYSKSKPNTPLLQFIRRQCSGPPTSSGAGSSGANASGPQKLGLFARFKAMYKDYWYVLVPVHVVTSIGWFGVFYKVSSSGVDIAYYLRKFGVNETVIKHVTASSMGHIAVAWALYKIATPARYAVTLGGTHYSINVLRNMGYIKPAKELMAKGRNKIQSLKDKKLPKQ